MSSQVLTPNTESAILARLLESDGRELTPEAARYLLSMKLPTPDEDRVDELSEKARAGSLTEAESEELDGYLHVGSLVAVWQSKGRRILKNTLLSASSESGTFPRSERPTAASIVASRSLPFLCTFKSITCARRSMSRQMNNADRLLVRTALLRERE